MAVNPTLAQDETSGELFPLPQSGEAFLLKREGIDFECTLAQGSRLRGRGCFFLSSKRIVFVSKAGSSRGDFRSFEVTLTLLEGPKFNQPIFGANFLSGKAGPSQTDPASAPLGGIPAPFSLTFNEGGCGTFVHLFYKLLNELKAEDGNGPGPVAQAAHGGQLQSVAYVDPNDPSVLYLSQPTARPDSHEETQFEVTYAAGELAEVKIIEGRHTGNWVKCTIKGPGSTEGTYNIHILPTKDYDSVGGFADKDVPDISKDHLRKAGRDSESRPGPCSIDGGSCIVS